MSRKNQGESGVRTFNLTVLVLNYSIQGNNDTFISGLDVRDLLGHLDLAVQPGDLA
jgi:hypothetical protein